MRSGKRSGIDTVKPVVQVRVPQPTNHSFTDHLFHNGSFTLKLDEGGTSRATQLDPTPTRIDARQRSGPGYREPRSEEIRTSQSLAVGLSCLVRIEAEYLPSYHMQLLTFLVTGVPLSQWNRRSTHPGSVWPVRSDKGRFGNTLCIHRSPETSGCRRVRLDGGSQEYHRLMMIGGTVDRYVSTGGENVFRPQRENRQRSVLSAYVLCAPLVCRCCDLSKGHPNESRRRDHGAILRPENASNDGVFESGDILYVSFSLGAMSPKLIRFIWQSIALAECKPSGFSPSKN